MIKFGTDGWRGIIADDFIVENVKKVAWAIGKYILGESGEGPNFGGTRWPFSGERFARISQVLGMRLTNCTRRSHSYARVCLCGKHLKLRER